MCCNILNLLGMLYTLLISVTMPPASTALQQAIIMQLVSHNTTSKKARQLCAARDRTHGSTWPGDR